MVELARLFYLEQKQPFLFSVVVFFPLVAKKRRRRHIIHCLRLISNCNRISSSPVYSSITYMFMGISLFDASAASMDPWRPPYRPFHRPPLRAVHRLPLRTLWRPLWRAWQNTLLRPPWRAPHKLPQRAPYRHPQRALHRPLLRAPHGSLLSPLAGISLVNAPYHSQ